MKKVLFICTHNASRSQMAEGFLNALCSNKFEAHSAGIEPTAVNPHVVNVMAEVGIDISKKRSKSIEEFRGEYFDYVVTVCDRAKETCPFFPGRELIHQSFRDPSKFKGSETKILSEVRLVRDEIKDWIETNFPMVMII